MMESLFVAGMTAAAAFDLARRRVPNLLNGGILFAGLGGRFGLFGVAALGWGLLGAALGRGAFWARRWASRCCFRSFEPDGSVAGT
jgi:hypothetical protein